MNKNAIISAVKGRSAIKYFDPNKKIADEDFKFLLEVAQLCPSSFGLEPWNILVIQNKDIRNKMIPFASGASNQLSTSSHFVVFTIKTDLDATSKYFEHINKDVKQLDEAQYNSFLESFSAFSHDKLNVYDDRTKQDWAKKQSYIAMANMLMAAAEIGIDSCPIEGFIINDIENLLSKNGLIDLNDSRVSVMAAFGYRDEKHSVHSKTRRNMDEIVRFID